MNYNASAPLRTTAGVGFPMAKRSKVQHNDPTSGDATTPSVIVADDAGSPPSAALLPEDDLRVYLAECDQAKVDAADDNVLKSWVKEIDEKGSEGGRVAYHVGRHLLAMKEAMLATKDKRRGNIQIWLDERAAALDRDDRTLRLYMQIATFVEEKRATPLPKAILACPLRDIPIEIQNVVEGRKIGDRKPRQVKDSAEDWAKRAVHLVERARTQEVPLDMVQRHFDVLCDVIQQRIEQGDVVEALPEVVVPPGAAVQPVPGPFKYPGGKSDHAGQIVGILRLLADPPVADDPPLVYMEPFVGGGSVLRTVAETCRDLFRTVEINDRHPATAVVYNILMSRPDELQARLWSVVLTYDEWMRLAALVRGESTPSDEMELAVATIATYESGYAAYGAMAVSPPTDWADRWDPARTTGKLADTHKALLPLWKPTHGRQPPSCTMDDACNLISRATSKHVLYLDPPYAAAGTLLYDRYFTVADHYRLRAALKATSAPWLLSYDDHALPRFLYRDEIIRRFPHPRDAGKTELLIWPKRLNRLVEGVPHDAEQGEIIGLFGGAAS